MIELRQYRRATLVVLIAGAGLFGIASAVQAGIPDAIGVIHGCYNTSLARGNPIGAVRVVDTAKDGGNCASWESPLNWNVKGITGSQGAQGVEGPQGPKGDQGDRGGAGPAGTNGTNGSNGANGTNGTNGVSGYQIVTQDETFRVPNFGGSVRAACPSGKHVLGGGAELTESNSDLAPVLTGGGPILGGIDWEATVSATFSQAQDEAADNGDDFFTTTDELVATVRVWAICATGQFLIHRPTRSKGAPDDSLHEALHPRRSLLSRRRRPRPGRSRIRRHGQNRPCQCRVRRGRLRGALEVQRSARHEVFDPRRQRITFALCNRRNVDASPEQEPSDIPAQGRTKRMALRSNR
jgi:hypothetical protein